MQMTREQRQKYLREGGTSCPYCTGDIGDCDSVEIEKGAAYQTCGCSVCGEEWTAQYTLVSAMDGKR